MKYFWASALIALVQLIILALMIKCMNHKKRIPAFLLFAAELASYYYVVRILTEKYLVHIIKCVCGHIMGMAVGAIVLYLVCEFLYPLVISKYARIWWSKLTSVPAVEKFLDKLEGIKHRLGIGNTRGFKVKKVKF